MSSYIATVFNSIGLASTQSGETPEDAIAKACNRHKDFFGVVNTYRPFDGVIFSNGKACGLVHKDQARPPTPVCVCGQQH